MMKKNAIILLLLFIVKQNLAQVPQFANIPNFGSYKGIENAIEINKKYYVLSFQTATDTNVYNPSAKNILYKILEDGTIEDSVVITNTNSDTASLLKIAYFSNNSIKLYGTSFIVNKNNNFYTNESFISFWIDTNLQIQHHYSVPKSDTFPNGAGNFCTKVGNTIYIETSYYNTTPPGDIFRYYAIDSVCNVLSSTDFGITNIQYEHPALTQYPNSNRILVSYFDKILPTQPQIFLQTDSVFNIIKTDTLGTSDIQTWNNNFKVATFNNKSYVFLASQIHGHLPTIKDSTCLCHIDTNFTLLHRTCLIKEPLQDGNTAYLVSGLDVANNNNIYMGTGYLNFYPWNKSSYQVANLDSNFNIRWQKIFGYDYPYMVLTYYATSDGGCLLMGYYNTAPIPQSATDPQIFQTDPFIVKINNQGNITALINVNKNNPKALVYPNPAHNSLTILASNEIVGNTFYIYNIQGQLVYTQKLENAETTIDINNLKNGNYVYSITNKTCKLNGKFLKN